MANNEREKPYLRFLGAEIGAWDVIPTISQEEKAKFHPKCGFTGNPEEICIGECSNNRVNLSLEMALEERYKKVKASEDTFGDAMYAYIERREELLQKGVLDENRCVLRKK